MTTLNQPTLIGQTIGHFRIIEEVGAGAMGVVYRAYDEHLDREVAVKVLAPGILKDRVARKRFREEARALSKLNHPNIAMVHDFDTDEGLDYLVMEYVPGHKLRDRISEGPLPEAETIRIATQLANGLEAAHSRGLVHRDLKPENLRLNLENQLKILDFGLAKLVQSTSDSRTTESDISAIAGTLAYLSPEQLRGGVVDQSSDLFSFGIVLYEMATGSHPFAKKDPSHVLNAILHQQPNAPAKLNPNISAELERIILKCLEKEPENRYKSVKEIATDLLQSAFPSGAAGPERAFALRKTPWKAIAAAALALGALLGVIIFVLWGHSVHALTESDTVVLAEFANRTGDSVFDDALNQALTIELEESPFLKILPQPKAREVLTLMGRSPEQSVTPEVAREICQRTGGKAVLSGSIASLGTEYVIGLRATECSSGNDLANEQAQFAKKESVLKVLGKAASHLRGKLGESLTSLQKFDTPLEQATTPSLEALKAYSLGRKAQFQQGNSAAIPFFKRAIELDPNFAVAYSGLGLAYSNLGEPGLANDYLERAYALRDRVSEREKLRLIAAYHSYFDGDLVRGRQIYELWGQAYPLDPVPPGNLGAIFLYLGDYQKAVAETLEHLRLEPDNAIAYTNLMVGYTALNQLDFARAAYQQAIARKVDDLGLHGNLYAVAFLQHDTAEMKRQLAWAADKPGSEDVLLSFASDTEAFFGRLSNARALSSRAVDSARRNGQQETAAGWQINAALREAEFGNFKQARQAASSALALASTRDVQVIAALTLARAGEPVKARQLTENLGKRFPQDTLINGYWLPTIRAAIEIDRRNPSKAINILEPTAAYELGEASPLFQAGGSLYPVYLRAQSYLLLNQGSEAANEIQKMLDHSGILLNCPLSALAHLALARALVMSGDKGKAGAEYRNFFAIWKGADPNIPILAQAKVAYSNLR